MSKFRDAVGLPTVFLLAFVSLWVAWKALGLPPEGEMIAIIRGYFGRYGYGVVFASAVVEGILLAGWYYPGSLVIFLGVIFAGKDVARVAWVVVLVTAGLFLAYLFNYALGKYGWYRLLMKFGLREPIAEARERLAKWGLRGIFLSYWQPNLAALTSTAAGILQFPFGKFALYSIVAAALWDAFWGALVYFVGEAALVAVGIRFVLVAVAAWILYRLAFRKKRSALEVP